MVKRDFLIAHLLKLIPEGGMILGWTNYGVLPPPWFYNLRLPNSFMIDTITYTSFLIFIIIILVNKWGI